MDNTTFNSRFQKAFVAAMSSNGVPEEATIAFMETGDNDEFYESKYREYYTTLADCYNAWSDGIQFERARIIKICEELGKQGLNGQYCADEIQKQKIEGNI